MESVLRPVSGFQLRGLAWEKKTIPPPTSPRVLGFEGHEGLLQELHRTEGNKDLTLKGFAQNLTCTGTKGKSSNFIGVWARPTC